MKLNNSGVYHIKIQKRFVVIALVAKIETNAISVDFVYMFIHFGSIAAFTINLDTMCPGRRL